MSFHPSVARRDAIPTVYQNLLGSTVLEIVPRFVKDYVFSQLKTFNDSEIDFYCSASSIVFQNESFVTDSLVKCLTHNKLMP